MKISLKNVGMLDEAEFDVGELTIICGENNTGKTYATYSLYGYLDFMRYIRDFEFLDFFEDDNVSNEKNFKLTYQDIKEGLEKHIKEKTQEYCEKFLVQVMAGKKEDFLNSKFNASVDLSLDAIKKAVKRYLDEHLYEQIKQILKHTLYNDGIGIEITKNKNKCISMFFDILLCIIFPKNFILSVERTGASIFQGELDFNKIAQLETVKKMLEKDISVVDIRKTLYEKSRLYPKTVIDNIDFIRNIKQISKETSMFNKNNNKEILNILGKIAGGKYKASDVGIVFKPKGNTKACNIEIASSSVRSLLMLYFYIFNIAQKGDMLMIDEPELNLHPNNQILMGRLIALLINAGIKVFITTHSDYIVREINNCIMLNNLEDEQIEKFKKYGYTKEYKLQVSKVKAYLAENTKGKSTLKPVEITSNQGIFMKTFDKPINSQNSNQGMIFDEVLRKINDK